MASKPGRSEINVTCFPETFCVEYRRPFCDVLLAGGDCIVVSNEGLNEFCNVRTGLKIAIRGSFETQVCSEGTCDGDSFVEAQKASRIGRQDV